MTSPALVLPLPAQETLQFLERALPAPPARVLEVGCGNGLVAAALAERGCTVDALDESLAPDPAASSAGGGRLRWIESNFLYFEGERAAAPYDVVLFTRSLHHISPIERAVERAAALLAPGGRLVAEEFAFDQVDLRTAGWWYQTEQALVAEGVVAPPDPAFSGIRNPLGRWRAEHTHEPPLATAHGMLAAVRARFALEPAEEAPYLYRYAHDRVVSRPRAEGVARAIFEAEAGLIRERAIAAAGLRIVATIEGAGMTDAGSGSGVAGTE